MPGEPLTPEAWSSTSRRSPTGVRLAPDYDAAISPGSSGRSTTPPAANRSGPIASSADGSGRSSSARGATSRVGTSVSSSAGGFCRVLQFAATPRKASTVFARLRQGALENGAAGIYGRLEPLLFGPLSEQRILLRPRPGPPARHGPRRRDRDRDRARRRAPEPDGRRVVVRCPPGRDDSPQSGWA